MRSRKALTKPAKNTNIFSSKLKTNANNGTSTIKNALTVSGENQRILFSKTSDRYGCFSNFSPHPIKMPIPLEALATPAAKESSSASKSTPISDKIALMEFQTSEHYFQAMKFPLGSGAFFLCVDAASPGAAKKAGGNRSVPIRDDWNDFRHSVMLDVLREKFGPSSPNSLHLILMETGDAEIVEHSRWDKYWGDGGNGSGQNHLGKTLMRLRDEFRKGSAQTLK